MLEVGSVLQEGRITDCRPQQHEDTPSQKLSLLLTKHNHVSLIMFSLILPIWCSILAILSIAAALPSQKLLDPDETSPPLSGDTSLNLPLIIWHGLGDK